MNILLLDCCLVWRHSRQRVGDPSPEGRKSEGPTGSTTGPQHIYSKAYIVHVLFHPLSLMKICWDDPQHTLARNLVVLNMFKGHPPLLSLHRFCLKFRLEDDFCHDLSETMTLFFKTNISPFNIIINICFVKGYVFAVLSFDYVLWKEVQKFTAIPFTVLNVA